MCRIRILRPIHWKGRAEAEHSRAGHQLGRESEEICNLIKNGKWGSMGTLWLFQSFTF